MLSILMMIRKISYNYIPIILLNSICSHIFKSIGHQMNTGCKADIINIKHVY